MTTMQAIPTAAAALRPSPLRIGERATVLIPIGERRVAVAFVRRLPDASLAAVVFGPGASRAADGSLEGWQPETMRKLIVSDLPLRTGFWETIDAEALGAAGSGLAIGAEEFLREIADRAYERVATIEIALPAPDLASHESAAPVYVAEANVAAERALAHLLGETVSA